MIQDPILLSNHLYAAGVIPDSILDEVSTVGVPRNAKNNAILNAVEARLRIKPSDLWVVAAALEAITPLKILATRLRDSYGTLICLRSLFCVPLFWVTGSLCALPEQLPWAVGPRLVIKSLMTQLTFA